MLNYMEQRKYEIIGKVVNGELTRKEAMFELNKSRQQIYRLIQVYEKQGEQGFIHKNRNKESIRKINQSIIDELEDLYLTEFYDFNFVAFYGANRYLNEVFIPKMNKNFLTKLILKLLK